MFVTFNCMFVEQRTKFFYNFLLYYRKKRMSHLKNQNSSHLFEFTFNLSNIWVFYLFFHYSNFEYHELVKTSWINDLIYDDFTPLFIRITQYCLCLLYFINFKFVTTHLIRIHRWVCHCHWYCYVYFCLPSLDVVILRVGKCVFLL